MFHEGFASREKSEKNGEKEKKGAVILRVLNVFYPLLEVIYLILIEKRAANPLANQILFVFLQPKMYP